jgi:hypothetical protein
MGVCEENTVGRALPFREEMRLEAQQHPLLEDVIRKCLVKILKAEKDLA